jgi:opacity protein-like surface antigen
MKRQLVSTLALASLFALPASAQKKDDSYHGGFTIFGGLTSFSIDVTPTTLGTTFGNASGFAAGAGLIAHLGGPIGLELDGDYVQGGFKETGSVSGSTVIDEVHDNNAGGALLLRPAFGSGPVRVFLQGGASVAYTINCSQTVNGTASDTCKISSSQNRTDESLVIGAGASYGMIALQVRYHVGLNNLTNTSGVTIKSKGLLVLASLIL